MAVVQVYIGSVLQYLRNGQVVGVPTDTVYGLAADACNGLAVAEIYNLKNRPAFNPLIIHVHDLSSALDFGVFNNDAVQIAQYFWSPSETASALTIVVPLREKTEISSLALAGLDTIALRVPNHSMALQLLRDFGGPLAAPSANISNYLSPTTAEDVRLAFPDIPVLDGGQCAVGIESTIVSCIDGVIQILRPGIVTKEEIEKVLGKTIVGFSENLSGKLKAPGALKKHYAPKKPMAMNISGITEGDIFIGFGPLFKDLKLNLSPTGDLKEAAANLFRYLHIADSMEGQRIAISPVPNEGIGIAINDRLRRGVSG